MNDLRYLRRQCIKQNQRLNNQKQYKNLLNGVIEQDVDFKTDEKADLKTVTKATPTEQEVAALLFASKVCKHTKSNTIIFAVDGQLISSGET